MFLSADDVESADVLLLSLMSFVMVKVAGVMSSVRIIMSWIDRWTNSYGEVPFQCHCIAMRHERYAYPYQCAQLETAGISKAISKILLVQQQWTDSSVDA